jgi:hypothetical protein
MLEITTDGNIPAYLCQVLMWVISGIFSRALKNRAEEAICGCQESEANIK